MTFAMSTTIFLRWRTAITVSMVNMPGRYRLQPHLTKLLKRTKKHWAWIPRDTLDAVIIRLHIAWERFFNIPGTGKAEVQTQGDAIALRSFSRHTNLKMGVCVSLFGNGILYLKSSTSLINVGFRFTNTVIGMATSVIFKSFVTVLVRIGFIS